MDEKAAVEMAIRRSRAHLVLVTHLPMRDWLWLGLRRRCRYCGQGYPCPPRQVALDRLAREVGAP